MAKRKNKNNKSDNEILLEKKKLILEYGLEHGIDFENRIIRISGDIEDGNFDLLDFALTNMEAESRKAITIRISSPGGSVYEALSMIGRIQASKCQIITEGYGQIMSAAVLLLACGNKRRISQYSWFMHHESSMIVGGSTSELKEELDQMEREERTWCTWMEQFSGRDKDFWFNAAQKKNFYLSAQECLDTGIVDEVI